jgi:4-hydroxyphenylacetate 3-monooxygenase
MFYAGARFVTTGHSYRTFDWGAARGMVDHLMSTYDLDEEILAPAAE